MIMKRIVDNENHFKNELYLNETSLVNSLNLLSDDIYNLEQKYNNNLTKLYDSTRKKFEIQ